MTKATYICRTAKKKLVTSFYFYFYFYFLSIFYKAFFGRFVTREVQKHGGKQNRKNPSGLITKNVAFFSAVFFFTFGCLSRFWGVS
jgi:hypothetical protein